jgi:hypothetical protein
MKVKLYSNRNALVDGSPYVPMLYPIWGKPNGVAHSPEVGRYDRYAAVGSVYFALSDIEDADVVVLPSPWEHTLSNTEAKQRSTALIESAHRAGKPVVVFFWSDSDRQVDIDNALVFRTSLYRSTRRPGEWAMPAWSEDFVDTYLDGKVPLRSKAEKAAIGFCGYAPLARGSSLPLHRKAVEFFERGRRRLGRLADGGGHATVLDHSIRERALDVLAQSSQVKCNFVIRTAFMGGVASSRGGQSLNELHNVRRDYVANMVESDYVLCARGAGNFSYRLYETLCCGRIPVFIDTDCVLPYDFEIDWKQYCVWVDGTEVSRVAERVSAFHDQLSDREFSQLQQQCRQLWLDYLSPQGFFKNFHKHLQQADNPNRPCSLSTL